MAGENLSLIEIVTKTTQDAKFFSQALQLARESFLASVAFTHPDVTGLEGLEVEKKENGEVSKIVFMFRSLPLV